MYSCCYSSQPQVTYKNYLKYHYIFATYYFDFTYFFGKFIVCLLLYDIYILTFFTAKHVAANVALHLLYFYLVIRLLCYRYCCYEKKMSFVSKNIPPLSEYWSEKLFFYWLPCPHLDIYEKIHNTYRVMKYITTTQEYINIYILYLPYHVHIYKRNEWKRRTLLAKSHFPQNAACLKLGNEKTRARLRVRKYILMCVCDWLCQCQSPMRPKEHIRRVLLYFVFHSALLACKQSWNLFSGVKCFQDAVHITAILGESVVFNCHVEFPGDHPVPYVLQWEKKVGDTVGHQTLLSNLNPLGYYDSRGARQSQYIRGTGRRSYYQTWVAITFVTGTERDNALLH